MIFLAGLLNRSSLSFIFVSVIRMISIIAILFTIAIEIYLVVHNIHGVHAAPNLDSGSGHTLVHNGTNGTSESSSDCGYIIGTNVPKSFGGALFFVLGQFFNMAVLILCLLSELSFPTIPEFFEQNFPPLGPTFGVGFLGALEVYVSCVLLSYNLSLVAIASGWILFIIGVINVFLGIILGRRIRAKRSLLDAGTAYAKKTAHIDDIEGGIRLAQKAQKSLFKGKKGFKTLRPSMISRPKPASTHSTINPSRGPLDVAGPMMEYIQARQAAKSPNHSSHPEAPPIPAPPPPIYDTFKKIGVLEGSRRRPSS